MTQLSKANTLVKYNDSGSGLFKDQTAKEIGADDSRALVLDTTESVPYTLDDSYTWAFPKADTSGTDTYTATLVPHINAYANGMKVHVKVKTASTGASTINFNSVGTRKIYINPTTQAGNGDLVDEQEYIMSYDSALDGGSGGFLIIGAGGGGASAAEDVTFTPAGSIVATDVQAAIEELDTEKAPLASPTFTGTPAAPTASNGTNTTQIATTAFVQAAFAGGVTSTTGTAVAFAIQQIYGSVASPETGNITLVTTGLVVGMIQKMYHDNGTEPTYPAEFVRMGQGTYSTAVLNVIYMEAVSASRIEYWIDQEQ